MIQCQINTVYFIHKRVKNIFNAMPSIIINSTQDILVLYLLRTKSQEMYLKDSRNELKMNK